jgi:hypothetical protein
VTRVLFRQALSNKHVAKVAAASSAFDFDSLAVGIRQSIHGARYLLIERQLPAMGVELVVGPI